ncbi:fasciclin domain-containing protein [Dokdonella sp.]|uniref:fasciclin domain-containing protein n=1 Tax=Dokdonella sp. TaxID=2291710 RepID=UPI002F409B8B
MNAPNQVNAAVTPGMSSSRNLLETAAANGTFKTFGKAVERAGMTETLRGTGPYTVFAPTDAAFAKLPTGKLDTLFKPENKDELVALINYHVVNGRRSAADVRKWDAAKTLNGQAAPIKVSGDHITIDGAEIVSADIDSSNGVLHAIDKVNMPAPTRH